MALSNTVKSRVPQSTIGKMSPRLIPRKIHLRARKRTFAGYSPRARDALLARWRTAAQAKSEEAELQFEEAPPLVIMSLGLHRDGALPIEPPPSQSPRS